MALEKFLGIATIATATALNGCTSNDNHPFQQNAPVVNMAAISNPDDPMQADLEYCNKLAFNFPPNFINPDDCQRIERINVKMKSALDEDDRSQIPIVNIDAIRKCSNTATVAVGIFCEK